MKLQEFISETLKEILAGVKEAQKYAESHGAWVSPQIWHLGSKMKDLRVETKHGANIEHVEFDVAVTSTEGSTTEAGAGIFVAAIGLGTKGQSDTSTSSISRIKFSIPVALPMQTETKEE